MAIIINLQLFGSRGASSNRRGLLADSAKWEQANRNYAEWQSFQFNNPNGQVPDDLNRRANEATRLGGELMERAVRGSDLLTYNENTTNAFGKGDGFNVSVRNAYGKNSQTSSGYGAVIVQASNAGNQFLNYQFFDNHAEAVAYAEDLLRRGIRR